MCAVKEMRALKRILFAEDERPIRDFVVINLERDGWEVTAVGDGEEALAAWNGSGGAFDVVLLDIMMPRVDGLEVCRRIREQSGTVGIIMLTARTQERDKIAGLGSGADDYISKPFSPAELIARTESLYRRVAVSRDADRIADQAGNIALGDYALSIRSRSLTKRGEPIDLTQVEFQIMEYFFENPGVALTRDQILRRVWGESFYGDEKVVDVNIRRLRIKVEDDPGSPAHLLTVWGLGYKWET